MGDIIITVPDGDDVWKQNNKTEQVSEPGPNKSLQSDHNNRENHLSQEQSFC